MTLNEKLARNKSDFNIPLTLDEAIRELDNNIVEHTAEPSLSINRRLCIEIVGWLVELRERRLEK